MSLRRAGSISEGTKPQLQKLGDPGGLAPADDGMSGWDVDMLEVGLCHRDLDCFDRPHQGSVFGLLGNLPVLFY